MSAEENKNPEELARVNIDADREAANWVPQDRGRPSRGGGRC